MIPASTSTCTSTSTTPAGRRAVPVRVPPWVPDWCHFLANEGEEGGVSSFTLGSETSTIFWIGEREREGGGRGGVPLWTCTILGRGGFRFEFHRGFRTSTTLQLQGTRGERRGVEGAGTCGFLGSLCFFFCVLKLSRCLKVCFCFFEFVFLN